MRMKSLWNYPSVVKYLVFVYFQATVQHAKGTYVVNEYTVAVNGIKNGDLDNGLDFKTVSDAVKEILSGKLVITCDGAKDFACLDLVKAEYQTFDIQLHWTKWDGNYNRKTGEPVMQPIGLRSLSVHYLKYDPQAGMHTASSDARATVEMFEVYKQVKNSDLMIKEYRAGIDEFAHIKTIKKRFPKK